MKNLGCLGIVIAAIYAAVALWLLGDNPNSIWTDTMWGLFWGMTIFGILGLLIKGVLSLAGLIFQGFVLPKHFGNWGVTIYTINTSIGLMALIVFGISRILLIIGSLFLMTTPYPETFSIRLIIGILVYLVGTFLAGFSFTSETKIKYTVRSH